MHLLRKLLFHVFLLLPLLAFSQVQNPVKWKTSVKRSGSTADLIITAKMDKGWHIYAQRQQTQEVIATTFTFEPSDRFDKIGVTKEPGAKKKNDEIFGIVYLLEGTTSFTQKISIKGKEALKVRGTVEFQTCDDTKCLTPETIDLSFDVPAAAEAEASGGDGSKTVAETLNIPKDTPPAIVKTAPTDTALSAVKVKPRERKPIRSLWKIFIAGFIGGLLALLTPCVFPMIPLTVSFFTKQSKTRAKGVMNALIYSLSIILIYVTIGFLITKVFGSDALNELASSATMNLIFFVVFIVFAISFLGAFEITLPSSWINKADAASDRGGLIGIFFMAFTLSLVSFSCTGPIIGTLLVEAAVGGDNGGPLMGMFGFSLALALPFGLFAAFPGWLNSLPKSGGWLNSVKVVLGLLELALALKFLSNVDLAYHWNIITREVFIAIWIIIFTLIGLYMLGKIRFSHDTDSGSVSIPGLFLAIISFSFVVYLVPGMFGAPLKMISGFPPPIYYTEGWSLGAPGAAPEAGTAEEKEKGIDRTRCPHNLPCFKDYNLALAEARRSGKPLFVDFTGYSCVNCRKMEDQVWSDPRVLGKLKNDYVLVSLYVDDKHKLAESEQYVSPVTGKKIRTLGNKWSDLQTTRFRTNSQPYYVLLDHKEEMLIAPSAYDPNIENFLKFLNEGIREFQSRNK